MITEQEKNEILSGKKFQISSSRALIQQILLLVLLPVVIGFIGNILFNISGPWRAHHYFAMVLCPILIGYMVYMHFHLATAILISNQLIIKRLFKKEETINVSDILDIDSFRIKRTTYLSVSYSSGVAKKKVWIMKPSIFHGGTNVEDFLYAAILLYKS